MSEVGANDLKTLDDISMELQVSVKKNWSHSLETWGGDNSHCLWTRESGRYEQNGCVGSMRSEAMADYSSWGSWGATGVTHAFAEHKNQRARYCLLGAHICHAAKSAHWCCTVWKGNGRLH
jgi:hypothetical protein